MGRRTPLVALIIAAAGALWLWQGLASPQERQIRRRVADFAAEFNSATTGGLGIVARAARLGQFFTSDAVLELGRGSPAIQSRNTLIGMATRLQPRTADVTLELTDVNVDMADETRAAITLTVVTRRRGAEPDSLDAREFVAELQYVDGEWRASRVSAVDTFR